MRVLLAEVTYFGVNAYKIEQARRNEPDIQKMITKFATVKSIDLRPLKSLLEYNKEDAYERHGYQNADMNGLKEVDLDKIVPDKNK